MNFSCILIATHLVCRLQRKRNRGAPRISDGLALILNQYDVG